MQNGALQIAPLMALQANDLAGANNVLRYWLKQHHLAMPSQERLQAWWQDLSGMRLDQRLHWAHDGQAIRGWRGLLQIDTSVTQQKTIRGEWIFTSIPQTLNKLVYLGTGIKRHLTQRPLRPKPARVGSA